jgi:hypothetical protein
MKLTAFWDIRVLPCSLEVDRRSRGVSETSAYFNETTLRYMLERETLFRAVSSWRNETRHNSGYIYIFLLTLQTAARSCIMEHEVREGKGRHSLLKSTDLIINHWLLIMCFLCWHFGIETVNLGNFSSYLSLKKSTWFLWLLNIYKFYWGNLQNTIFYVKPLKPQVIFWT